MIISTTCNRNLLFFDKQYLNILKSKKQIKNSFIGFQMDGSMCGFKEIKNSPVKFASEMSLVLNVKNESDETILLKPLDVDRSTYYCDDTKFYISQGVNQSTSLKLSLFNSITGFERLLNISCAYNSNLNSYSMLFTYLERRTE